MKESIQKKLIMLEAESKQILATYNATLGAIQILKEVLSDIETKGETIDKGENKNT